MPDDEELLKAITASTHAATAMARLLSHIICLLVDQLPVDRRALIAQIEELYAPADADASYQIAYNNLRKRVVQDLRL